ncbi:MAG: aquaporin [Phycisphaeraceae bacterium]|nr:aquaporin [Phycisphaeraceae bacterium]MCW5755499.1 aquaporin [Phycisphaeraceae bacterium]
MRTKVQKPLAEFLGTFALVFVGVGSILVADPQSGLLGVALAHGLVLSIFVTACMYISGAQFNPAVSIALAAIGKQSYRQAGIFILVQCFAAACAAGAWVAALGPEVANNPDRQTNVGATIGSLTREGNIVGVLILETLATFGLMWAILAGTVDHRAHRLGGFVIGLTVAAMILAIGPLTGASMNPARTLGPALYGHWDMFWAYLVAPAAGALLAATAYSKFWAEPEPGTN